jgi:hypothetical protein
MEWSISRHVRQNIEKVLTGSHDFSEKILMTLVEASKTTNRNPADTRYLWVEGVITLSESHFQASKML